MSMNTVTRTLTPEMAAAASTLVKMARAGDTSLSRALDRAQERLFSQPWAMVGGILQIASLSQDGETRATDGTDCSCPTTKGQCWHKASHLILSSIAGAGVLPFAPIPLPVMLTDDDGPADSFLDGPFDAYDDSELTAPEPVKREWYSDEGGGDFEEVDGPLPEATPKLRGVWYRGFYYSPESLARSEQARSEMQPEQYVGRQRVKEAA